MLPPRRRNRFTNISMAMTSFFQSYLRASSGLRFVPPLRAVCLARYISAVIEIPRRRYLRASYAFRLVIPPRERWLVRYISTASVDSKRQYLRLRSPIEALFPLRWFESKADIQSQNEREECMSIGNRYVSECLRPTRKISRETRRDQIKKQSGIYKVR